MTPLLAQADAGAVPSGRKPTRPLVQYHGGKWKLAKWIISYFPPHRVYVEAFGGGGSVLLQKERSYAEVYNDIDGEMVNLFRVVREHPAKLTRAVMWTPFSRDEYRRAFETDSDCPIEIARRTIVRSFMGFGSASMNRKLKSGFRANSNKSGTTPAHDWVNLPPNIRVVGRRFRGVIIENKAGIEVSQRHDGPDTLHYLDPPYVHSTRKASHGYAHEMTDRQHEELADASHGLQGMVILSGYPSALYDRLYADWHCVEREALADGAKKRTEKLWINPRAWSRLAESPSLFAATA